jgi:hypothetical protein
VIDPVIRGLDFVMENVENLGYLLNRALQLHNLDVQGDTVHG